MDFESKMTMPTSLEDVLIKVQELDFQDCPLSLLGVCAVVVAGWPLVKYLVSSYRLSAIKEKIRLRQTKRNIDKICESILIHREDFDENLVKLSFKDLHERLQNGSLKAWDVVMAYSKKALQETDKTNCVVEFLEDAFIRAKMLDRLDVLDRGPLHGIPISIKEDVGVKGLDSTLGLTPFIGQVVQEDSVLLQTLLIQGAVPFVRTNLAQAKLSCECSNPIFGVTTNPRDKSRTSGGSSGGEAALIAGGGSILGLGCDMAGSNRIPAHCCGVVGFKCTPERMSNYGNHPAGLGIKTISEVYSPLGRDVDAIVQYMRATCGNVMYQLDPTIPRMPWNEELYSSEEPLIIGYYVHDGGVEAVPAVRRAIALAKKLLEKNYNYKVVAFHPPKVPYMFEKLFLPIMTGDKCKFLVQLLKNDITDPTVKSFVDQFKGTWSQFLRKLKGFFSLKQHKMTKLLNNIKPPSGVGEWWEINMALDAYKINFIESMKEMGMDCLICPTLPMPAWPHNKDRAMDTISYTSLYNVLGFPAGSVPTTNVTREDVANMKHYPGKTSVHKFIIESSQDSEGLPIGVQCVGLPHEDENVLRLMKELETAIASYKIQEAKENPDDFAASVPQKMEKSENIGSPEQEPESPEQEPESPEQEPESPEQEPESPEQEPESPEQEPESPEQEPEEPEQEREAPKEAPEQETGAAEQAPETQPQPDQEPSAEPSSAEKETYSATSGAAAEPTQMSDQEADLHADPAGAAKEYHLESKEQSEADADQGEAAADDKDDDDKFQGTGS